MNHGQKKCWGSFLIAKPGAFKLKKSIESVEGSHGCELPEILALPRAGGDALHLQVFEAIKFEHNIPV